MRVLSSSDAHSTTNLALARWGIATARRAWLTAADVANTLPWAQFRAAAQARAERRRRLRARAAARHGRLRRPLRGETAIAASARSA